MSEVHFPFENLLTGALDLSIIIRMSENTFHLSIEELAERVNTPVRTVRYYITEGLLPGPVGRGKATVYSEEHLLRLGLIRILADQHRPLAEIHQLVNRLSLAEIRALLAEEEQRVKALTRESQQASPQEYVATLLKNAQTNRLPAAPRIHERTASYGNAPAQVAEAWKRIELAPGVELHVKEGAEEQERSLVERLCKAAAIPAQAFRKSS